MAMFIDDFGAKLTLLLKAKGEAVKVKNHGELCDRLDINTGYWTRLKRGQRPIPPDTLRNICELFGMSEEELQDDLYIFGQKLGLTRRQVHLFTEKPIFAIDFNCRIRDAVTVRQIYENLRGYYALYGSYDKDEVGLENECFRSLFQISGLDSYENLIDCALYSRKPNRFGENELRGVGFPTLGGLYFILESISGVTEIVTLRTESGFGAESDLVGIRLGLSEWQYPEATKVLVKYICRDINKISEDSEFKDCETFEKLKEEVIIGGIGIDEITKYVAKFDFAGVNMGRGFRRDP